MNIRVRGLEDAARLAMGNFLIEESQPAPTSAPSAVRIAMFAGAAVLMAIVAFTVLQ